VFTCPGLADALPRLEHEFAAEVAGRFAMTFRMRDASVATRLVGDRRGASTLRIRGRGG